VNKEIKEKRRKFKILQEFTWPERVRVTAKEGPINKTTKNRPGVYEKTVVTQTLQTDAPPKTGGGGGGGGAASEAKTVSTNPEKKDNDLTSALKKKGII